MIFLTFFCLLSQVELFIEWHSEAKNRELFASEASVAFEQLPLLQRLSRVLEAQGLVLNSWPLADADLHIFWGLGPKMEKFDFHQFPKEQLMLFIWEPPTVQPKAYEPAFQKQFGKIFTWDDDLVDGKRFFKFHYPVLRPRISQIVPFEKKKFCTLIASRLSSKHPKELYGEREKIIRFFENKAGEFDLYGKYWEKRNFKNYRGPIGDKIEVLKNYKYSICYENTKNIKGYITEKIFDCFQAGVIPVYLGAENVEKYIPAACFIDRRHFKSDADLYAHLQKISPEEYNGYLEAARLFLESEEAQLFSESSFIHTLDRFFSHAK